MNGCASFDCIIHLLPASPEGVNFLIAGIDALDAGECAIRLSSVSPDK